MKRPGLVPLCLRSFGDGLREIISGFYFLWGGVVPRLFWMCSEVLLGLVRGRVERGWNSSSPPVRKRCRRVLTHRVLIPNCVDASLMLMRPLTMARTTARLREYVIPQLACSSVFGVSDVLKSDSHRITVLGEAFKPDSDDLRDLPALDIALTLWSRNADVVIHDPKAGCEYHGINRAVSEQRRFRHWKHLE